MTSNYIIHIGNKVVNKRLKLKEFLNKTERKIMEKYMNVFFYALINLLFKIPLDKFRLVINRKYIFYKNRKKYDIIMNLTKRLLALNDLVSKGKITIQDTKKLSKYLSPVNNKMYEAAMYRKQLMISDELTERIYNTYKKISAMNEKSYLRFLSESLKEKDEKRLDDVTILNDTYMIQDEMEQLKREEIEKWEMLNKNGLMSRTNSLDIINKINHVGGGMIYRSNRANRINRINKIHTNYDNYYQDIYSDKSSSSNDNRNAYLNLFNVNNTEHSSLNDHFNFTCFQEAYEEDLNSKPEVEKLISAATPVKSIGLDENTCIQHAPPEQIIRTVYDKKHLVIVKKEKKTNLNIFDEFLDIYVLCRLRGGKGGFGANLRNKRKKKKKRTSVDASRNLKGNRLIVDKLIEKTQMLKKKKFKENALISKLNTSVVIPAVVEEDEEKLKKYIVKNTQNGINDAKAKNKNNDIMSQEQDLDDWEKEMALLKNQQAVFRDMLNVGTTNEINKTMK